VSDAIRLSAHTVSAVFCGPHTRFLLGSKCRRLGVQVEAIDKRVVERLLGKPAAIEERSSGGRHQHGSVEAGHTQVMFSGAHMGLSNYGGVFSNASGSLKSVASPRPRRRCGAGRNGSDQERINDERQARPGAARRSKA